MLNIDSMAELASKAGQEIAISPWVCVNQAQINQFAEATGDHQWIHVDPERTRKDSPFGRPIAHGFLTLSLLPTFMQNSIKLPTAKMSVNYGLNRVRFISPVPVGSSLRARIALLNVKHLESGVSVEAGRVTELVWEFKVELQGSDRLVCVAESISRRYW